MLACGIHILQGKGRIEVFCAMLCYTFVGDRESKVKCVSW